MTRAAGVIHTTWADPECTREIKAELITQCMGTELLGHLPSSYKCSEMVDGNPSTLTAFQNYKWTRNEHGGEIMIPNPASILWTQRSSPFLSYSHLFIYKSSMLKTSRQLSTFTIQCGSLWSQTVDLKALSSWTQTEDDWVAVPFDEACKEKSVAINNATSETTHLYISELSLGKNKRSQAHQHTVTCSSRAGDVDLHVLVACRMHSNEKHTALTDLSLLH